MKLAPESHLKELRTIREKMQILENKCAELKRFVQIVWAGVQPE